MVIFVGPTKIIDGNNIVRYNIPTKISVKNNNNIIISSIERGISGYKIFEIILKNNNDAHIENISKTLNYSCSEIPNIKTFNKLKEIINNVNWINNVITPHQDIFIKFTNI